MMKEYKNHEIVDIEGYQQNTLIARVNGINKHKVSYNDKENSIFPDRSTAMDMLKDMI